MTRRAPRILVATVAVAALLYGAFFTWLALERHHALMTHTADLGQIDLAVWNTLQGRFVQEVKGEEISTRLTDHVEPIFWPVSLVLALWDDAAALLSLQAVVIGFTALVVWAGVVAIGRSYSRPAVYPAAAWAALAYLLAPQAQAATVADFHASPLAVLPLALLLYLGQRRLTAPALVAAMTALAVKEEIALVVIAAGLYLAIVPRWRPGLLVAGLGAAWFVIATFGIIPHYGAQVYGEAGFPYLARYDGSAEGSGSGTPVSMVAALVGRLADPNRLLYMAGLLLAFAGAPLLAPEVAVVASPLVAANVLSHYPAQYSGEFHYSAPFMSILAIAAGVGSTRALSWARRRGLLAQAALVAILAVVPFAYHLAEGFTPLGPEFRLHRPHPGRPDASRLAPLLARIPSDASLSVTPALHPHFSHRQHIYTFPDLAGAELVLIDVAGTTDMHPADLRRSVDYLLAQGYGVVDGNAGILLLQQGAGGSALPDPFLTFTRPTAPPEQAMDVTFGTSLRLLGYRWLDDAKWGYTSLRLYWQALARVPNNLTPYAILVDGLGRPLHDTRSAPFIEPLWYPLDAWVTDEIVVTTTVAVPLGDAWGAYVGVVVDGNYDDPAARLAPASGVAGVIAETNLVRIPPVRRMGAEVVPHHATPPATQGSGLLLGSWLRLEGSRADTTVKAGDSLDVATYWSRTGDPQGQLALSLRLLDAEGNVAAQTDGSIQSGLYPPARWPAGEIVADAKSVSVPDSLAPGSYSLAMVAYDRLTGVPLSHAEGASPIALGSVTVVAPEEQP